MTVWEDLIVTLDVWEVEMAAQEALRRWARAERRGAADRGGVERALEKDVAGVCGEVAVAKLTGRYWTAGEQGAGDVGGLEVRTRRSDARDERPHLLIQPYDEQRKPAHPFVLVVGQRREFRCVGWTTPLEARRLARAGGAKVADPGGRGRPCIAVPQNALLPVDEFRVGPIPQYLAEAS